MSDQNMEQGPAPSIEQRVGSAFSNMMGFKKPQEPQQQAPEPEQVEAEQTAPPEEQQGEAPVAEETFEFEIDGQKYALPKALEKAVMQERDYTQKSQVIADQRRTFEALNEQAKIFGLQRDFESTNAEDINRLRAYDEVLKQPIDWASLDTNEAFRKKLQI